MKQNRYSQILALLLFTHLFLSACQKPVTDAGPPVDVVLIGAGIMSATLGSLLTELNPEYRIHVYERLNDVGLESSSPWNNAGTGHASYSELNYTPEVNGGINIKKAIDVNAAFEISKQYWSYLVETHKLPAASSFINKVPHMSFVWGEKNVQYLKKRFDALTLHPYFHGMIYSEDPKQLSTWFPLVMAGRDPQQKIAATRMEGGTDVNFGALTHSLFDYLKKSKNNELFLQHEVVDIKRNDDQTWRLIITDLKANKTKAVNAKFVFIGAGGGALPLLQKTKIEEADGFGGFPIGGAWLVTDNPELIEQHAAKVYGQAGVGTPPMSVPHLDTRYIDGKKALLFGPFATFSTKYLKTGSWTDLFGAINFGNILPLTQVGIKNFELVTYLVGQVLMNHEDRMNSLREYIPKAKSEDWRLELAGQRVQVIKKDPEKGGILQFGTELVISKDGSMAALLGASPGASTAVKAMLGIMEKSFATKMAEPAWQQKIKEMIPTYGVDLDSNINLLRAIREHNARVLGLPPQGFLMPDITP